MSTLGFTNVYNIGGFHSNPGIRDFFPTVGVPEPEPEEEVPVAPEPVTEEEEEEPVTDEEPITDTTPPAPATAEYRIYTVVSGDSLYRIARTHLGSGARWVEIFELNRNIITNPNMIHIGWQLRLPA